MSDRVKEARWWDAPEPGSKHEKIRREGEGLESRRGDGSEIERGTSLPDRSQVPEGRPSFSEGSGPSAGNAEMDTKTAAALNQGTEKMNTRIRQL